MKLYFEILKLVVRRYIGRQSSGAVVRKFAEKMGLAYIKFAQMLAMQNFGEIFTEEDRRDLSTICDRCNPIKFAKVEKILKTEYGETKLAESFLRIDPEPVGSASISQVHRAWLRSGEMVAIKIKREDVTRTVEKDVARMRKIVHRFGRLVKFGNFSGGDAALDLYLGWISEETNFRHECENIKTYQKFCDQMNQKKVTAKEIHVPKLYAELCTENVIVMEFIAQPTINQLELTQSNKQRVTQAMNSYIQASFYAFFHDEAVVFHGDPHGGNMYLDAAGNLGFLDMGLLFVLSEEDKELTLKFFLAAYAGNVEKLYEMLIPYGKMSLAEKEQFRADIATYCAKVKCKNITFYFIDMMNICLKYEFLPPKFLFCMAKAFVCLNGISVFTENATLAQELLQEQTTEFLLRRTWRDSVELVEMGLGLAPKFLAECCTQGMSKGFVGEIKRLADLREQCRLALTHFEEMCDVL